MNQRVNILLIDDNEIDHKVVSKLLESYDEPYHLVITRTLKEAKNLLEASLVDIIILDLHLPDSNVEQTLLFVEQYEENYPIIILSTLDDKALRISAIQKGAQDYFVKNEYDAPLLARVIKYSLERHRLHKQLHAYARETKEKELRLMEAQAIAQIGNWDLLLDNDTIEWSPQARTILELEDSRSYTSLSWFIELLDPGQQPSVWNIFRQAVLENTDFNIDLKVNLPTGKIKYLNLRIRSTGVQDEREKGVRGTIQDITARKEMEAALVASEERYHRLFEESTDAIFITTEEGSFVDFNPAMVELFGYSANELANIRVNKLYFNPYDREKVKKLIAQRGLIRDYEVTLKRKDGKKIDCMLTSAPWVSLDGKQRGYQGIIRDITEIKRTQELIRNKEIAERSARLKQRFLANMSHEIRTPITAIAGLAHLISKTDLTDKQREYVEGILTSSEHLLALVNDILDFSKIEEGKITFHSIEFNLREHLVQLIKTMEFSASAKGIDLRYQFDPAIPDKLVGDPIRLNQIVYNLLSNAIKFTEKGFVNVTVSLVEDARNAAVISIIVKDTGVGIPSSKINTIFRSFTQLGKDITKTAEGTGLGLAITKQLVELQGGSISVKSQPGRGSAFEVIMMFKKQKEKSPDEKKEKETDKPLLLDADIGFKKILIVEDKKLNQLVISEMLKSKWPNIELDMANDGKEAIEKIKNKKFDLVLMDVQMPVMDGYEATKIIREHFKKSSSELPILAITAYNTEVEIQKCQEYGMNDFVSKPFEPDQLYEKVMALLHTHPVNEKRPAESGTRPPAKDRGKPDLSYLDVVTNHNAALKEKIIQMLIDETPDELFTLQQHVKEKNWKRVRAVAHKMKSSITYLGLTDAFEAIKKIEDYAGQEVHLDQVPSLLELVARDCTHAINELVTHRSASPQQVQE
ncbi:MAG: hypothetical protein KatS3mg031_1920 [Chitinophagales bacterium]|nr:MAG: hypothetical protein KatS3mg031_1920 [Chitinophagales bacterium]